MLAEKLLLGLLIIIIPNLIHGFFNDVQKKGTPPYLYGLLQGTAALLCLIFSYSKYGLFWDLRYIPLVISILYGGRLSGAIVIIMIVGTRTLIGGDSLWFGYLSIIAASAPFLIGKSFMFYKRKKRMSLAAILGLWSAFASIGVFFPLYLAYQNAFDTFSFSKMTDIIIFVVIYIVGLSIAISINEAIIDRWIMKEEIRQTEKIKTLGELAASIAHEIRNPLTVVKGFLQFMNERNEVEKNAQYFKLALGELSRAEAIINEYLIIAKPHLEKIEEIPLSSITSNLIILLEPMATKQGIILEGDLEGNPLVSTDKNQLQIAIINLIKNAVEASSAGDKVSIRLRHNKDVAEMLISDTGKGMTNEQLSRIGTLFYSTKEKGTGLGTMVSIRIIKEMNGEISYKSVENVGTEVIIRIPTINKIVTTYRHS